jgi:hypothetical protein
MKDWLIQNWKPLGGTVLLLAIYALSKHPALAAERELLESIAALWGVYGFLGVKPVESTRGD